MRRLIVSLHDVSPGTLEVACALRASLAQRVPGPVSLLVVARRDGREEWLGASAGWLAERIAHGDEPVLHGLTHRRWPVGDEREFAGSPAATALARLRLALEGLREAGIAPSGFIAPCYAHPPVLSPVVASLGLDWWATRARLHWAGGRRALPSVGLGASTSLRRACSPSAALAACRLLRHVPVVRLDLHPADVAHRGLRLRLWHLLDCLLAQGRALATHGELVRPGEAPAVRPGRPQTPASVSTPVPSSPRASSSST